MIVVRSIIICVTCGNKLTVGLEVHYFIDALTYFIISSNDASFIRKALLVLFR